MEALSQRLSKGATRMESETPSDLTVHLYPFFSINMTKRRCDVRRQPRACARYRIGRSANGMRTSSPRFYSRASSLALDRVLATEVENAVGTLVREALVKF